MNDTVKKMVQNDQKKDEKKRKRKKKRGEKLKRKAKKGRKEGKKVTFLFISASLSISIKVHTVLGGNPWFMAVWILSITDLHKNKMKSGQIY